MTIYYSGNFSSIEEAQIEMSKFEFYEWHFNENEIVARVTGRIESDKLVEITEEAFMGFIKSTQPPKPTEQIVQLEAENALLTLELVNTQIQLDQVEQEQA